MSSLDEKAISTKKLAIVLAAVIASASAFTYLAPAWNDNTTVIPPGAEETSPVTSVNITGDSETILFGIEEIDSNVFVDISYTTDKGTVTKRYRSSSFKYESDNRSLLVYEHGVKVWYPPGELPNASLDGLVVGDEIDIPLMIVSGPEPIKVLDQATGIVFRPIKLTRSAKHLKYVNITMDTRYPEAWSRILIPGNTLKTRAYVGGNSITGYKVYINTTVKNEIDLPDEAGTQTGKLHKGVVKIR